MVRSADLRKPCGGAELVSGEEIATAAALKNAENFELGKL
jgi:hypothetical protein